MQVTVKLFATFRDGRFKEKSWELADGTVVQDVLVQLQIEPSEVAILLVNGRDAKAQTELRDGDTLALFPPVGGG